MRTVAIIGGGPSGTALAISLLRQGPRGTRIALIERRPPAGPGAAFGTRCPVHLLNVAAGRMSLYPDDPDHFLRWARNQPHSDGAAREYRPDDFLPRELFGSYLVAELAAAEAGARPGVQLEKLEAEAIDIEEIAGGARVLLADRRSVEAEAVVLALGNLPGEYPVARPLLFYRGPRYVHVPWPMAFLENLHPDDDVLLVGAGLTAVDIIAQLEHRRHRGVIHALSRRGLRPRSHRPGLPKYPPFLAGEPAPPTARAAVNRLRREIARAAAAGTDWRAVIDSVRPQTQGIWSQWSWAERARFLRHARPFWEAHRHRIAPEIAATIERLAAAGRVQFHAGRLENLLDLPTTAEATFRLRQSGELQVVHVAKVINCTGPRTDYSKYQHPLLVNLLARGLIGHDPLALGINALPNFEVLRYHGGPTGWLFTLGAPLKGMLWESTAWFEIRGQASDLAARLARLSLAAPAA
jgi:uncharacterized NAD(P)/FAD-binding protein YdhS